MKKYWLKRKRLAFFSFLMIMLTSAIQISFEYFKGAILDSALQKSLSRLLFFAAAYGIAVLLKALTHYLYTRFFGIFKTGSLFDIRESVFKKLIKFSYPEFLKKKRGEYVSVFSNEIDVVEFSYFESWYGFLQIVMEVFFSITALLLINKYLCLVAVLILIPSVLIPQALKKESTKRQDDYLDAVRKHTGHIREWIQSFEIIENYGVIPQFLNKHSEDNKIILKKADKLKNITVFLFFLSKLLMELNLLIIISVSIYLLVNGKISAGLFITSIGLMSQLQGQVMYVAMYLHSFIIAKNSIKRINDFTDTPEIEKTETVKIDEVKEIIFKDICFNYKEGEKRQLISNFNLQVNKCGIFVIQGESGSGKSTLMNLLLNYFEADSGEITINSTPVKNIENLQELITIMRQEQVFFDDSLRNNISAYDENIDDEKIIEGLKNLNLEKYAATDELDKKMNYKAEEFSGGQAARLSLLRSLLKNRKVLILDEPFASVDEETAEKILTSILEVKDKIIFLITHILPERLSQNCEQIIKLANN